METLNTLPLTEALHQLLDQKLDCDVTFYIGGEDIQAHKFMLNFRCPGLYTMIHNKLAFKNGKVIIDDPEVLPAEFRTFLEYLYTDTCRITDANVKTLLHLGDMYDVPNLLEYCTEYLERRFSAASIINSAQLGILYSERCSLLAKCLQYISHTSYLNRYSASFHWKLASPELVLKVAQECKRWNGFTEDVLFKAIIEWAKQECVRKKFDINAKNMNTVLSQIILHIKFQDLKPLTLATTVTDYKLLTNEKMLECLRKAVIEEGKESFVLPKRPAQIEIDDFE
uniref:BTB domain-containing protein n=1 Tax=Panagrolaimus superbus TaxID=310955 RepID=A0A914XWW3_9BILA